ncbi:two component, sigma54 specific, transcriptional regulator, Fis family [Magnetococcus marinus MC-1]|uniref:Two component, sigma54 specific, transcriptional regulator, Fis family n=1 Tax=Magnetococcus marinus (strain ATCC BAA-1437 / JCM 17883 / MC-1) TaxID=156889 RepID=A0LAK3_MAGMM|nr:sigma-54 dependent transcriptional regulator [Magnetococcus marinus]ABK44996.1 two component, sigma54 specific, transcriptional regulator, Fis family [Magnetococcus marinus MC-1]
MVEQRPTILVVDDELRSLESLARILEEEFDVKTAQTVAQADAILQTEWVQVVLCDQRMPEITGVAYLKKLRDLYPDVIRMIISGYSDPEDIIHAVNEAGIYHYISKPWHPDSLLLTLSNATRLYALQRQNQALSVEVKMTPQRLDESMRRKREGLRQRFARNDGIVRSRGSCMDAVCQRLKKVSPYDVSVLLTGDSGTGKELAAKALHYSSLRWDKAFVVENCGALPDQLLESELFGYKKGAFTGAVEDRIGLFERADGGTLFLDEIGEISPAFQVKLLRVLQEGEIRPLGSSRTRKVDVRLIAATNRDLETEMLAGRFRPDLYYRLAAVTIYLPALKARPEDIPALAHALLEQAMESMGKQVRGFTEECMHCLQAYPWPGNVRELQNEIQHMLVMAEGDLLGADLLSARVLQGLPWQEQAQGEERWPLLGPLGGSLKERVELLEARIVRETLIRHRWNKSRAAKELGLSRVGLRSKLERYGLEQRSSQDAQAQA